MADGYTRAYLLPRPTVLQVVERAEVDVDPDPDERAEHIDVFGNRVLHLGIHRAHDSLRLLARSEVVVEPGRMTWRGEPWEVVAMRVAELRGGDALAVRPVRRQLAVTSASSATARRCAPSPRRRSSRIGLSSTAHGTSAT